MLVNASGLCCAVRSPHRPVPPRKEGGRKGRPYEEGTEQGKAGAARRLARAQGVTHGDNTAEGVPHIGADGATRCLVPPSAGLSMTILSGTAGRRPAAAFDQYAARSPRHPATGGVTRDDNGLECGADAPRRHARAERVPHRNRIAEGVPHIGAAGATRPFAPAGLRVTVIQNGCGAGAIRRHGTASRHLRCLSQ
jgi:hypothetical protein